MITTRNLELLDTNIFEFLLLNSSLSKNFETLSLLQSVEKYNSTLLDSLELESPAEIKIIKHRPEQPWFTSELRIFKEKETNFRETL